MSQQEFKKNRLPKLLSNRESGFTFMESDNFFLLFRKFILTSVGFRIFRNQLKASSETLFFSFPRALSKFFEKIALRYWFDRDILDD